MVKKVVQAEINVTDKGLEETTKKTAKLNHELDKAQRPRTISVALDKSSEIPSGLTRGTAAGGGRGDARDFSRQAQGLGGLVHLYATFAANIFAVSAAYIGLERAFQASRLEESAAVIGSKIGVNVKGIAKDLQEATGHAINFKDALEFTNTGIGVGLTGKQIKNLTVIARGAANALGRDTTDSVQRIIRGTAKQEQEILDELGIFVKAKQAYKDYADSRGIVNENTLSSTQKVAAYAEAVEKAGEKWKEFAEIKDPFSKLTANVTEVAIKLANVFNKAFVPIISVLADYPSVITGIMLAVVAKLASVAVPEAQKVMAKLFTVDANLIKEQQDRAFNSIITGLKDRKAAQMAALTPGNKNVKDSIGTSGVAGLGLDNYIAADLARRKSLQGELVAEKSLQAAASQRLATIRRMGNEQLRNAEIAKLEQSGLFIIDGLNQKILLSEKGRAVAEKEVGSVISNTNRELLNQKAIKGSIVAITKEIAAAETAGAVAATATNKKLANAQLLNASISSMQTGIVAADGLFAKLKSIALFDIGAVFAKSGKSALGFVGIMNVAKVAVSGLGSALGLLMGPIGWLLTAWSLWDIAFKPLLTSMGLLSKESDMIADTNKRLGETNEVVTKTLYSQSDALKYVGNDLDALGNKYKILGNIAVETMNAQGDAYKSLIENLPKLGFFEKAFGGKNRLVEDFANENIKILENLVKTPGAQNVTLMKYYIEQMKEAAKTGSLEIVKNTQAGIQAIIGVESKAAEAMNNTIQIGQQRVKDLSDLLTGVKEDLINNSDEFAGGLRSDKAQAIYKNLEASVRSLSAGGAAEVGTLAEQIAKIDEATVKAVPEFSKLVLLVNELNKSALTGKSIPQTVIDEILEATKVASKAVDTVLKPKKDVQGKDTLARIFRQRMDLLAAERSVIDSNIAAEELQLSIYEKRNGVISEDISNKLYLLEISKIEKELAKQILEAEEKRRLSLRNKDVDRGTANKLYSLTENAVTADATNKAAVALQKLQESILNSIYLIEKNRLNINKQRLSVTDSEISAYKEVGMITEEEFNNQKYLLDLENLAIDTKIKGLGLDGIALELANEEAVAALQNLNIQKGLTDEILRRRRQEEVFQNKETGFAIAIEAARRNNVSTVQLEIAAMDNKVARTRQLVEQTTDQNEKLKLQLQLYRDTLDALDRIHEARKRAFRELDTQQKMQTVYDEAAKQAREFEAGLKDTVTGTFDAIYAGMDAAIDELTTKWMKSEKVSIKDLILTIRNTMAEEIRKMAADQMKAEARKAIVGILGKILPGIDMRTNEEKSLEYAKITAISTAKMAGDSLSGLDGIQEKVDEIGTKGDSVFDKIKDRIFEFGTTVWSIFKGLGSSISDIFTNMFTGGSSGGSGGGGGILGSILGLFGGGDSGGSLTDLLSEGTSFITPALDAFEGFSGFLSGFADGGIMTEYGPMKLNKYARGGIVNSPQMFVAGEGKTPEAMVPLPDGRTIPVTMTGGGTGNPVNVNININTTTGSSSVTTSGSNADDMKRFGILISNKVKEEIIIQQRSGNLLNRRT